MLASSLMRTQQFNIDLSSCGRDLQGLRLLWWSSRQSSRWRAYPVG
jgi:hypothetical protein